MVTIRKGTTPLTLINVFHVKPEQQQALADLLVDATEQAMSHQPGFISASIHKSYDGRRVVNMRSGVPRRTTTRSCTVKR